MQQLQPLKSSSGPLGLAPGGGRDRDRHQPCCGVSLETAPPAQWLSTDCSGTGATRGHSLVLCSGRGESVMLRTTHVQSLGMPGPPLCPCSKSQTPSTRGGHPSTHSPVITPVSDTGCECGLTVCSALTRSLGAAGEGGGLMPQLDPSPTLMLPAVGAAPWQGPLSSPERDRANGQNPRLWGKFC